MTFSSRVAIGISIAVLCLSSAQAQEADLVLRNGVIWTVDDDQPRAEAVASLRDRIIYVGSDAGVARHIGAGTTVIDLDGAFVTPGYNDNHVHFASTGRLLYGLNLLDVSDEEAFVARVRDVHGRYAPGSWITGGDWSAYEAWAEGDLLWQGRRWLGGQLSIGSKGLPKLPSSSIGPPVPSSSSVIR